VAAGIRGGAAGCHPSAALIFGAFKKQAAAASVTGKKTCRCFKAVGAGNGIRMTVCYSTIAGLSGAGK